MSAVVISGDTSGTVTLNAPAVAGSTTINLAASSGTLNAAGPAFSAYANAAQTVTLGAATKVAINTEEFDTNNNFDATTNYRFTPTVEGYYQVNATLRGSVATTFNNINAQIYKNGSAIKANPVNGTLANGAVTAVSISAVVYMNGSTDYLEFYGSVNGSGTATFAYTSASNSSFFSACFLRGA